MAEVSNSGTYVKILCHIWYDKKADNIHVTSNDRDLPKNNMHMTAKKGTQSDANLRVLLDKFGCGPTSTQEPNDPLSEISFDIDSVIHEIELGQPLDAVLESLTSLQAKVDGLLKEVTA